jgi:hypothetical protein
MLYDALNGGFSRDKLCNDMHSYWHVYLYANLTYGGYILLHSRVPIVILAYINTYCVHETKQPSAS